jgi:hypothetical protein
LKNISNEATEIHFTFIEDKQELFVESKISTKDYEICGEKADIELQRVHILKWSDKEKESVSSIQITDHLSEILTNITKGLEIIAMGSDADKNIDVPVAEMMTRLASVKNSKLSCEKDKVETGPDLVNLETPVDNSAATKAVVDI